MKPEDSHCKALVMFQRPKGLQGIQDFFLRGGGGGNIVFRGNRGTGEQENKRTGEEENGETEERENWRVGGR